MDLNKNFLQTMFPSKVGAGLDIGRRLVKLVQLKKVKDQICLDQLSIIDLAKNNSQFPENDELEQRLQASVEAGEYRKKLGKINIAGSSDEVNFLDLKLPKLPPKELRKVIIDNIEEQVHSSSSDFSIDHIVLLPGEPQIVRVFYSELKRIDRLMKAFVKTDLQAARLNAGMLANLEMLEFNGYLEFGKSYICVEIGEFATTTMLITQSQLSSVHSAPGGLSVINENIKSSHGADYSLSESLKLSFLNKTAEIDAEIDQTISYSITQICEQIQKGIDFFRDQDLPHPLAEILLVGGGSAYQDFSNVIQAHNNLPTTTVDPFRKIDTLSLNPQIKPEDLKKNSYVLGPAVGLALGGVD